ncbi:hypothetical protein L204_104801 [Cryptococcus depauperatus]|nr:hypothetical protein L204_05304 [Cryptococcus depauperatus CBS 7855]
MSFHPLNLTLSFSRPSFHPILRIELPKSPSESTTSGLLCQPLILLSITLPDGLFVDPDELEGRWPVNLGADIESPDSSSPTVVKWFVNPSVVDIERPLLGDSASRHTLSLAVKPPARRPKNSARLCLPLHVRYLPPSDGGWRTIVFPGDDGSEIRSSWQCIDSLTRWPPDFHDLPRIFPQLTTITLPTGKYLHQDLVEVVTPMFIWVGWAWIVWRIWKFESKLGASQRGAGKHK